MQSEQCFMDLQMRRLAEIHSGDIMVTREIDNEKTTKDKLVDLELIRDKKIHEKLLRDAGESSIPQIESILPTHLKKKHPDFYEGILQGRSKKRFPKEIMKESAEERISNRQEIFTRTKTSDEIIDLTDISHFAYNSLHSIIKYEESIKDLKYTLTEDNNRVFEKALSSGLFDGLIHPHYVSLFSGSSLREFSLIESIIERNINQVIDVSGISKDFIRSSKYYTEHREEFGQDIRLNIEDTIRKNYQRTTNRIIVDSSHAAQGIFPGVIPEFIHSLTINEKSRNYWKFLNTKCYKIGSFPIDNENFSKSIEKLPDEKIIIKNNGLTCQSYEATLDEMRQLNNISKDKTVIFYTLQTTESKTTEEYYLNEKKFINSFLKEYYLIPEEDLPKFKTVVDKVKVGEDSFYYKIGVEAISDVILIDQFAKEVSSIAKGTKTYIHKSYRYSGKDVGKFSKISGLDILGDFRHGSVALVNSVDEFYTQEDALNFLLRPELFLYF